MPNSASAKKRDRQNEKRRVRNKARKTELKTIAKKVERAINDGNRDEAEMLYRRYAKRLDQAQSCSVLHKNAANRHKSRMAGKLHASLQAS
ncbi:MAG: 30S ribosomal protein S20 [Planctomycetota bacterium]|nr:MAG: 30S ribosomal protein S20 [Planctomycetota bacterium]